VLKVKKKIRKKDYKRLNSFFKNILNDDKAQQFYSDIQHFLSGCDIKIQIFDRKTKLEDVNIGDVLIRNDVNLLTINNTFTKNYLKYNQNTKDYYITNNKDDIEYVINNPHDNSCFITILINVYKCQIENKKDNRGKKVYDFDMTYENIFI